MNAHTRSAACLVHPNAPTGQELRHRALGAHSGVLSAPKPTMRGLVAITNGFTEGHLGARREPRQVKPASEMRPAGEQAAHHCFTDGANSHTRSRSRTAPFITAVWRAATGTPWRTEGANRTPRWRGGESLRQRGQGSGSFGGYAPVDCYWNNSFQRSQRAGAS